jgi:hypothetical protein
MTSAAHDRAVRGLLAANDQAVKASNKAVHALIEDGRTDGRTTRPSSASRRSSSSSSRRSFRRAHVQQSRDAAETLGASRRCATHSSAVQPSLVVNRAVVKSTATPTTR